MLGCKGHHVQEHCFEPKSAAGVIVALYTWHCWPVGAYLLAGPAVMLQSVMVTICIA